MKTPKLSLFLVLATMFGCDSSALPPVLGDDGGVPGTECPAAGAAEPGLVPTSSGWVRGSTTDTGTWSFRGIPYAAAPVGDLRFRPPAPAACAPTEIAATDFGAMCPQFEGEEEGIATGRIVGDEDCLTLNVWTPPDYGERTSALPVLFFIHGGGNTAGSSSKRVGGQAMYDGERLAASNEAVVVTINYRLGPLGYLTLPSLAAESEHASAGNYGLLDQIAALAWVRDNIGAFGGDPARVLVFGESGGAVDTCMMVATPLAAGLFSAALMESGACAAQSGAERQSQGAELAAAAGCDGADEVACLRALSVEDS